MMDSLYQELLAGLDDLPSVQEETNGLDAFLGQDRVKLSSFDQLLAFSRIGEDTLVHKSKKDLWKISVGENGEAVVERLFDPNSNAALRV